MIPTLPLRARNRLAETILRALSEGEARRTLSALATGRLSAEAWLGPDAAGHAALLRRRARRASEALRRLGARPPAPTLAGSLEAAAALFDAGLGFEVHELLETHWTRASGDLREALQGLIQIAVGYQHLANGNLRGARALLEEGSTRLVGRRLADLDLAPFAGAVAASLARLPQHEPLALPRFPRRRRRAAPIPRAAQPGRR
jgi:predicted metal-dependent hydrolase